MIANAVPTRRAFAEERATTRGDLANLDLAFGMRSQCVLAQSNLS
jgi:hypothetical protein